MTSEALVLAKDTPVYEKKSGRSTMRYAPHGQVSP